jgi:hypothetical protein
LASVCLGAHSADSRETKTPQTPWSRLSTENRTILSPLAPDWDTLPGLQQKRLVSAARQYPKMNPVQQERFQERLRDWAAMTPAQRKAARETFQGLQKLPPSKQNELRERWLERKASPGPETKPQ